MPLSEVKFNVGTSGIGRRAVNTDKISGLLFFNNSYPSGFTAANPVKKVFALSDAIALGITKGSALFSVEYYHISEFFRANPDGEIWIGIYPVDNTYQSLPDMLLKASGEIRQIGIYNPTRLFTNLSSDISLIQALIDFSDALGFNCVAFLAIDYSSLAPVIGWNTLTDLRTLTSRKVNAIISQDGNGEGKDLYLSKGYSITTLGHMLGFVSKGSVSQSIGNPANFNASNGLELEVPALANGDLVTSIPNASLGALKDKAYTILRKYVPQISGSYYERQGTSVPFTNSLAYVEFNRAMDKAIRLTRSSLTPQLNGQLFINGNGTLRADTVGYFLDLAQTGLDQMVANNEISAGLAKIDPTQNVLATNTLNVSIQIVPVGIAEQIVFNIGLVVAIS
jgi:hypothetical protein